ncbi:helix-turn-helix domain-containing protein [Polaromonas sp. CG_9.11]|uniref:helix-turn-helix domain-containing protein n=1 Tax=Polaromonas sp. CG_9.11 TaxID=2787730 RepID=UPI001E33A2E9|nr:helix-turn-helix domain-containing protein [Polaromonas sp. CG_9.11]
MDQLNELLTKLRRVRRSVFAHLGLLRFEPKGVRERRSTPACAEAGYGSSSAFSRAFMGRVGLPPGEWLKKTDSPGAEKSEKPEPAGPAHEE